MDSTERLELVKRICGKIVQTSVKKACESEDIPESTFFTWVAADKDLAEEYMRVRAIVAFKDEQDVEDVLGEVRRGEIDPSAARVYIDGKKWQAGHRNSKVYGPRTVLAGDPDAPLVVSSLSDFLASQDGATKGIK